MQHVCKSCKCDSSILRHCMRERGGGEEEGKRRKQELGTSAGQTRQKTTGGWRCCLWPLIQGRIKRRRGRTEEPGSLVGWRWRGSPTAVDTQAQRRDWISAVAPC